MRSPRWLNWMASCQSALEDAFATAKAEGADVDFEQTVFPNWDPAKEYSQADYQALG